MPSLAPSIHLLLQAADSASASGTRIVLEHTWLDTAAGIAQSLVSILVVVMLVMGVLLLYALKKSIDELSKLIRNAYEPLRAAITEAREVTGEVRALAKGLKAPVDLASETITEASERVRAAMDVAEGRLARLDALVDIAQEEAEGVVVGAASLVRGVRAGGNVVRRSLGFLAGTHGGAGRDGQDADDDESEEIDDDATDDLVDDGEDAADDEDVRLAAGGDEDADDANGADDVDAEDEEDDDEIVAAADDESDDEAEPEAPRIRRRLAPRSRR